MAGIVIVSHSGKAAEGIAELAAVMSSRKQVIIPAGGESDGSIGICREKVKEALTRAFDEEGVLVLVDMGSAAVCVESIVSGMGSVYREKIRIANAAVLEGAIAAAVQISLGCTLDEAEEAATEANYIDKLAMSEVFGCRSGKREELC